MLAGRGKIWLVLDLIARRRCLDDGRCTSQARSAAEFGGLVFNDASGPEAAKPAPLFMLADRRERLVSYVWSGGGGWTVQRRGWATPGIPSPPDDYDRWLAAQLRVWARSRILDGDFASQQRTGSLAAG